MCILSGGHKSHFFTDADELQAGSVSTPSLRSESSSNLPDLAPISEVQSISNSAQIPEAKNVENFAQISDAQLTKNLAPTLNSAEISEDATPTKQTQLEQVLFYSLFQEYSGGLNTEHAWILDG